MKFRTLNANTGDKKRFFKLMIWTFPPTNAGNYQIAKIKQEEIKNKNNKGKISLKIGKNKTVKKIK